VLLGFAAACVVRTRTGEPGAAVGIAVALVLMAPSLVPQIARWIRTLPAPGAGGAPSDHVWWIVLAVCVMGIAISVVAEGYSGGCPGFRDPGDDDPGNTHCVSRQAAPLTLQRSGKRCCAIRFHLTNRPRV
jgi:hypothetical protein